MFLVEIGGMRALYTGDYSRIPDRHLPGADVPKVRPDIGKLHLFTCFKELVFEGSIQELSITFLFLPVIVESTYGVRNHLPRSEREQNFLKKVRAILDRGGNVLLPVVALGRAQVSLKECICSTRKPDLGSTC